MIRIDGLCKSFGPVQAVRDLSLHVPAGELFCFLGPNGAGKTTTIKILTGLMRPDHGTALVAGLDIQAAPVEAKRRIGYIPDMPFLYERLTASEFFHFAGELHGMTVADISARHHELFDLFSLNDYRKALVKDLSHGLRQRLIYASTLLHNPDVLFIDEPLIGLDPYTIRLIKELLRRKARAGMTVFLTTHILALAEDIADRIGIILQGSLVALGRLPDLLAQHNAQDLEHLFIRLTGQEGRLAEQLGGELQG